MATNIGKAFRIFNRKYGVSAARLHYYINSPIDTQKDNRFDVYESQYSSGDDEGQQSISDKSQDKANNRLSPTLSDDDNISSSESDVSQSDGNNVAQDWAEDIEEIEDIKWWEIGIAAIGTFFIGSFLILVRGIIHFPLSIANWYAPPEKWNLRNFPDFSYWSHRILGPIGLVIGLILSFLAPLVICAIESHRNAASLLYFLVGFFDPKDEYELIGRYELHPGKFNNVYLDNQLGQKFYFIDDRRVYFNSNYVLVQNTTPKRNWYQYLIGIPGSLLILAIAIVFGPIVSVAELLIQTPTVFLFLCKQYWDFAWALPDLSHDKLNILEKRFSLLGFLLSTPIAAVCLGIRILGFVTTTLYRGFAETLKVIGVRKLRLENKGILSFDGYSASYSGPQPKGLTEREHLIFKTLYANKCPITGRVQWRPKTDFSPPSLTIPPYHGFTENGGNCAQVLFNSTNVIKFLRKTTDYNRQKLHEKVLDRVYRILTEPLDYSASAAKLKHRHTEAKADFVNFSNFDEFKKGLEDLTHTDILAQELVLEEEVDRRLRMKGLIELAIFKVFFDELKNNQSMSEDDQKHCFNELKTLHTLFINLLIENNPSMDDLAETIDYSQFHSGSLWDQAPQYDPPPPGATARYL